MRRSHPSSLDPKGLAGISFDVCSIASTETASTVVGRGRGAGGLRKRRGGGAVDEDNCGVDKGTMGLYSDPFSSMFSPTSNGSVMGGFIGQRRAARSGVSSVCPSSSSSAMGPPDARKSHSTLIGSKQNTHLRSSLGTGAVQSVRVEISPTGSPVSPAPPAMTAAIAPTMNAFRRCLLLNKGRGGGGGGGGCISAQLPTHHHPLLPLSNDGMRCEESTSLFNGRQPINGGEIVTYSTTHTTTFALSREDVNSVSNVNGSRVVEDEDTDEIIEEVVEEEHHIFLFDQDDDDDAPSSSYQRSAGRNDRNERSHCGGKERRAAVLRRQQQPSLLPSSSCAPYAKSSNPHRRLSDDCFTAGNDGANASSSGVACGSFALARNSRRRRKVCRSRYDIEESDDEEGKEGGGAIYYVQVSHSALTPRDGPDDIISVPQMPLLPSSVATAVVDQELAVLEELML